MWSVFFLKCVEPRQRNKDGMQWIVHRFSIKGGISIRDVLWIETAESRNTILRDLLQSAPLLSSPTSVPRR